MAVIPLLLGRPGPSPGCSSNLCPRSGRNLADLCRPCQVFSGVYHVQTMYNIKEAAARAGVSVPVLRAWERRYGIVRPARSAGGYRQFDDATIARVRAMRDLVDRGWSPSSAAAAIVAGTVSVLPPTDVAPLGDDGTAAAARSGPASDVVAIKDRF